MTLRTITEEYYAEDILLANKPSKAESVLHSQEQVAGGIGQYVSASKT